MESKSDKASATEAQEWLLIGRIVGAHGLNGHVKVFAESDFPERFTQAGDRWLQKPNDEPNGEPIRVRLTSGRYLDGKKPVLGKARRHRPSRPGRRFCGRRG